MSSESSSRGRSLTSCCIVSSERPPRGRFSSEDGAYCTLPRILKIQVRAPPDQSDFLVACRSLVILVSYTPTTEGRRRALCLSLSLFYFPRFSFSFWWPLCGILYLRVAHLTPLWAPLPICVSSPSRVQSDAGNISMFLHSFHQIVGVGVK